MRKLLWHLVEGWNDLVRSQWDPAVPASTNRLEGWFGISPAYAMRRAADLGLVVLAVVPSMGDTGLPRPQPVPQHQVQL